MKISEWVEMDYRPQKDPFFVDVKARDEMINLERKMHNVLRDTMDTLLKEDTKLPKRGKRLNFGVPRSNHMWQAKLPENVPVGTYVIYVRTTDMFGQKDTGRRIIRVE